MANDADFDPAAVPIWPAATVMIVDDRPDLQVLMIRRNTKMVFAGGMWVFPGGMVDPEDAVEFEPRCAGLDDAAANQILGVDDNGLAYWVAAIRENFEEAGLLLATGPGGVTIDGADFADARRALNASEVAFIDLVRDHGLTLDTNAVHYTARWITPIGGPRRFDARFFVTTPPPGQAVEHDENETVAWDWVSPTDALERYEREEMVMMTPTVRMLRCLALFESADQVMEAAAAQYSDERARVIYNEDGSYYVVLPGEPGYESADQEKENGWIRLRPAP